MSALISTSLFERTMDELLFMSGDNWLGWPTFRGGRGGSPGINNTSGTHTPLLFARYAGPITP
eukprot:scaffold8534_cov125-Isochrysis_galbana.AAC.1